MKNEIKNISVEITPPQLSGSALVRAPQKALTAADAGTIDVGDAPSNTTLNNMRTRIGEIETVLKNLGLLKG